MGVRKNERTYVRTHVRTYVHTYIQVLADYLAAHPELYQGKACLELGAGVTTGDWGCYGQGVL